MAEDPKTFLLGVTGGIGSGKSEVCTILERFGARIFSADRAAKDILKENSSVRDRILSEFGSSCYKENGEPDHKYIAGKVFTDRRKLEFLNNMIHPLVYKVFAKEKQKAETERIRILVLEAALLYESGGDKLLDSVLIVTAPEESRIDRVIRRDQSTPDKIRARMTHQMDEKCIREKGGYVIDNNGTLNDLENQVKEFLDKLT